MPWRLLRVQEDLDWVEKMYSSVMERTVEANEAGRTEWPSLESSGALCCPIIQTTERDKELQSNAGAKISRAIKHVD